MVNYALITLAAVALLVLSVIPAFKATTKRSLKRRLFGQMGGFFGALLLLGVTPLGSQLAALAAGVAEGADVPKLDGLAAGLGFISAALSTGLSCLGAGLAVGSSAPAAIGAFAEDAKAFGKAMVFVVMGEGVALFGFLVSVMILGKI